jgi:folylpolyglutamate synthase/dihydropteroate synthase
MKNSEKEILNAYLKDLESRNKPINESKQEDESSEKINKIADKLFRTESTKNYNSINKAYREMVTENFVYKLEEKEVSSKEDAMEYAKALAKQIFDDVDESKVEEIVDGLISKNEEDGSTNWGAVVGSIKAAYTS